MAGPIVAPAPCGHATWYSPVSVPPDVAMPGIQADQFLGFGRWNCHRAGNRRQIDEENVELSVRARRQRGLEPFVEFFDGETPVACRNPELLRDLIAVLV
jgi:hypothetical protein